MEIQEIAERYEPFQKMLAQKQKRDKINAKIKKEAEPVIKIVKTEENQT